MMNEIYINFISLIKKNININSYYTSTIIKYYHN